MSKQVEYLGRGIHNKEFGNFLETSTLLNVIGKDADLDIQIRKNYLNVYYRGSNAANIKSARSIGFDKFYFYTSAEGYDPKKIPKTKIKEDKIIVGELKAKQNKLTRKFKDGDYSGYFADAKRAIDNWLPKTPKAERETQHRIAVGKDLDGYTVIDLEFEVSTLSKYKCEHAKKRRPRFDIIAVKNGGLFVIELKEGPGSLKENSGMDEHWQCFKASVGDRSRNGKFVEEMMFLLEQKKKFGLVKKDVSIIKDTDVKFLFAYKYKHDIPSEKIAFDDEFMNIKGKNDQFVEETIWLP